jgi:hypothetical protein
MGQPGQGISMSGNRDIRRSAGADAPWPPLITTAVRPAWVVWRDRGLTVLMWFMFALLLQSEFQFLVDRVSAFTMAEKAPDPHWRYFWEHLWPFMRISALLVIGLFVAGLVGLARARRASSMPPPLPLSSAVEADAKGLDEETLRRARTLKRCIVAIGDDGRYRIEP